MTIMTRRRAVLTAGLAFGLAGLAPLPAFSQAAGGQPIVVRHARGETTLPAVPKTILTFDLAALDTLDAIGVPVAGVPSGTKPAYLAKYDGAGTLKIGSLFEPDYEAISAAKPDLIIVSGRAAPKYAELSAIAPTIDLTIPAERLIEGAIENAHTLGRIFGKDAEVTARVERLRASIAELKALAPKAGRGLLILTTGGKLSAYGPGSRFGVLHSDYGVVPALDTIGASNHGQSVSFEFLLQTNPDWLYVIDRDAAIGREGKAARQLLDNEIVHKTTAWRKGQIVYLDGANWYVAGGGLTALQQDVDGIKAALAGKV